jgi:hypothetical protein
LTPKLNSVIYFKHMSMLRLDQHQPVAIDHPLVAPWARAQNTTTANVYRLATLESQGRDRPWQTAAKAAVEALKRPGRLVLSSQAARRRAAKRNEELAAAKEAIEEVSLDLYVGSATDEERAELKAALAEAQGIVKAHAQRASLPRRAARRAALAKHVKPALRRQAWDEHVRRIGGLS